MKPSELADLAQRKAATFRERIFKATKTMAKVLAAVTAVALVLGLLPGRALAEEGHWRYVSTVNRAAQGQPDNYVDQWSWTDSSGKDVDASRISGGDLNPRGYAETETGSGAPSWTPTGWERGADVDSRKEVAESIGEQSSLIKETDTIADTDPSFVVDPRHAMLKLLYGICAGISDKCLELSSAFCSVIQVDVLFSADLSGAPYQQFYTASVAIADSVALPYAYAFVGLVFIIQLISIADVRRTKMGSEQFGVFAETVLMFVIAITLINRSTEIMGAIYWFGRNMTEAVTSVLAGLGVDPSMGLSVRFGETFYNAIASVTYEDFASVVIYLIVSFATVAISIGCVGYIFTTAFLRMTEIYLRMAFAPIPIAFFASEKTRQMAWSYLKRFAAVCFQAALIVCALSLSALLAGVAQQLVDSLENVQGVFMTVRSVLPPIFALFTITALLHKTEQVAANIFGA